MKLYEVSDRERPSSPSRCFFRSIEDAESYIGNCVRYDAEHPEESGGVPGRDYLVISIVERESQPCRSCGHESENTPEQYANYPYCRGCHYVGAAAEDRHLNDLAAFRSAFPDAEVGVEHTGGGCFWLAFRWEGDPVFYCATAGEAELPEDDAWNDGWGVVCRYLEDENGYMDDEECAIVAASDPYGENGTPTFLTKRQVIAAIKKDRKLREKAGVS